MIPGMSSRIEPQDGAESLIGHPHRYTMRGAPGELALPPLCPNCGSPAAERIEYAKVFRRTYSDEPTEHRIVSVSVPFCARCAAAHRQQSVPPTPLAELVAKFAHFDMLGAVLPAAAAVFVGYLALKELFKGRFVSFLFIGGLAAVFALIAWAQRGHVLQATEHLRVRKLSDVTQAFDFSDDVAAAFEPPRFVCTVRDRTFAEAFQALNRDRRWHADSPQARADQQAAKRKMWKVGAVVAIVFVVTLIIDWLT